MTAGLAAWLLRRSGADRSPGSRATPGDANADGPTLGEVQARFYRFTSQQFHRLLNQALRALPAKPEEQERELALLEELEGDLQAFENNEGGSDRYYESRVVERCRRLGDFIDEQQEALQRREQELSDVVAMLTRSMADVTSENADLYKDIRAENARIAEAVRYDDLRRLRSVLMEVAQRLNGLVANKESRDRSRVDVLSTQVEALKVELSEMRRRADLDPMTEQLNRRCFDEMLSRLVSRHRGMRRGFAMVIFDLDDFKAINDHYGHHVGDRALIAFARHCRSQMRARDSFARIGGEEFAMLLEGASLRSALRRAEKICESIAKQTYAIEEGGNQLLKLTASAGVAAFRQDDTELSLFKRADAALYAAKAGGKNRAVAG